MPNNSLSQKLKYKSTRKNEIVSRYGTDVAKRPSTTFDSFPQDDSSKDDEDIVKALAMKKAESLSLPVGIREPSELKWYHHHDDDDGTNRYFPCRICDVSEAIYVNLEPLWDPEEVSLIQVLEYPSTNPFKGGKDRVLADLSSLQPYNNNSETVWDKNIYKQYAKQRRQQQKKGSITVSESDSMAGYIFLNRILQAVLKSTENSDDAIQSIENESDNDGDSWMETPYEVLHDARTMLPQEILDDKKTEPLRPGDVIRYSSPIYCAGDPRGKRVATVLSTDPSISYMIRLNNNEMLPNETLIKRVQVMKDGKLYPHDGLSRPIDSFLLKKRALKHQNAKTVLEGQAKSVGRIVNRHVADLQLMMTKEGLPIDLVNGLKSRREIVEQQKKEEKHAVLPRNLKKRKCSISLGDERERGSKRSLHTAPKQKFDDNFSSTSEEEFESSSARGMSRAKTNYDSSDEDSFLQSCMLRDSSNELNSTSKGKFLSIPGDLQQDLGQHFCLTRCVKSKKMTPIQRMKGRNVNFSSDDDSLDLKPSGIKISASSLGKTRSLRTRPNPDSKTILTSKLSLATTGASKTLATGTPPIQNKWGDFKDNDYTRVHETNKKCSFASHDDESYVDLKFGVKPSKTSETSDSESSMENQGLCLRRHGKIGKISKENATVYENLTARPNYARHDTNKLASHSYKRRYSINDKHEESNEDSSSEVIKAFPPEGGTGEQTATRARVPSGQIISNTMLVRKDNKRHLARIKRKGWYVVEEDDELEDSSEGSNRCIHASFARGSYPSIVTSIKKKKKSPDNKKKPTLSSGFEKQKDNECNRSRSRMKSSGSANTSCEDKSIISPKSSGWHPRSADRKAEKRKKVYGRDKKKRHKNRFLPQVIFTAKQIETSQLESSQG